MDDCFSILMFIRKTFFLIWKTYCKLRLLSLDVSEELVEDVIWFVDVTIPALECLGLVRVLFPAWSPLLAVDDESQSNSLILNAYRHSKYELPDNLAWYFKRFSKIFFILLVFFWGVNKSFWFFVAIVVFENLLFSE